MTERKTQKRRVRERMAKTGERYTAARRQLLAKAPTQPPKPSDMPPDAAKLAEPAAEPEPVTPAETAGSGGSSNAAPASRFRGDRGKPEGAAFARTGRTRTEWFAMLDAWGAADRSHQEIARWINEEHRVDGWWAQELTVAYEMATGRRKPGERPDGFSVSISKTIGSPVSRLYDAFVDEDLRARWLPDGSLRTRTATPHRTARFDWQDGASRLAVGFTAKGDARGAVVVQHERLPDADSADEMRAFWRERLAALQRLLEA